MILSVFPSLLSLEQISPFLIRLTLGGILLFWSYKTIIRQPSASSQKLIGIIEAISGFLLVIGLWSQVAALIVAIDLLIRIFFKIKTRNFFTDGVNYYFILLILAVSILVTGAGFLAFDMPL